MFYLRLWLTKALVKRPNISPNLMLGDMFDHLTEA